MQGVGNPVDYVNYYDSPLGEITLASDGGFLTGLWFDGQKHFAATLCEEHEEGNLPVFEDAAQWLDTYFEGQEPDFTPPFTLRGSAFCRKVWEVLLTIPYGQTMSYGEIARILAVRQGLGKMSARAVGGAVGRNALSIIIPCHRVVGAQGSLTGYAGGIDRKLKLLALEGADTTRLSLPRTGSAL